MKKIILGALLLLSIVGCKKETPINYQSKNYINLDDWQELVSKNDTTYFIDKKIILHEDSFTNCTDSVNFKIQPFKKSEVSYLPNQNDLDYVLFDAMLKCKYECSHPATFKVTSISIYKIDTDNHLTVNIRFLASNSFGTPGELNGYFEYDLKTHKLINKLIG